MACSVQDGLITCGRLEMAREVCDTECLVDVLLID